MTLGHLAGHIAEIPAWITRALQTDELDFEKMGYKPPRPASVEEIITTIDTTTAEAIEAIRSATSEELLKPWTLRKGDHKIFTLIKAAVIRNLAINHLVHHRGQLSVYLRMLDVPVPGMYGPSADEQI